MKKAELNKILHIQHFLAENDDFNGESANYQGNDKIDNLRVHVQSTLYDQ